MILTSYNQPGNTGLPTVSCLEDFAAPHLAFGGAGMEPMLASPEGGQPPPDPKNDLPQYSHAGDGAVHKGLTDVHPVPAHWGPRHMPISRTRP